MFTCSRYLTLKTIIVQNALEDAITFLSQEFHRYNIMYLLKKNDLLQPILQEKL